MRRSILWAIASTLTITSVISACSKSDNGGGKISEDDKRKDSALYYARGFYLWNDKIPSSFDAHKYDDPDDVMNAIRAYSIEPGFDKPVDRWSFAMPQKDWDNLSQGISLDYGMGYKYLTANDLRITYVEPASPGGKAHVQRSWQIKKINNITDVSYGNVNAVSAALFQSTNITLVFAREGKADTTVSLTAATYTEEPLVLDTVYNTNATKTGYMVYNSFLGDINATKTKFANVFNKFSTAGISDLIIDLRYNGGGYVLLQDELANYLAPNAANGQIMEVQRHNANLAQYDETVRYQKKGSLNLSRIFVITTDNTASASELLINSLRPFMTVKRIGDTTHGKPVGYFPQPVMGWVVLPVSSKTTNKNGEGNYYKGFAPDQLMSDGIDKNWGDLNERCLAAAISYIKTGAYVTGIQSGALSTEAGMLPEFHNQILNTHRFKGAIETPRR